MLQFGRQLEISSQSISISQPGKKLDIFQNAPFEGQKNHTLKKKEAYFFLLFVEVFIQINCSVVSCYALAVLVVEMSVFYNKSNGSRWTYMHLV